MKRHRDPILVAGACVFLLVAALGLDAARSAVGQPFPGFLVLENGVIPSAGLGRWPPAASGEIFQHRVVSIAGQAVARGRDVVRALRTRPPGSPVEVRPARDGHEIARVVEVRRFEVRDAVLLFGPFLLSGLALGGSALVIRFLRGGDRLATGTALGLFIAAIYALSAMDLYGPYRLFRLHALCESLLFAGVLHTALVFPHPSRLVERHPGVIPATYLVAALLAVRMQLGLYDPEAYGADHRLAIAAFGLSLGALVARQLVVFFRPPSFEARQRVKVVALGAAGALLPPAVLAAAGAVTGGRVPENAMGYTAFLFPTALGYAVLRHDLLGVDAILRRTVNYALLTGALALAYAAGATALDRLLPNGESELRSVSAVLFAAGTALVLGPLRDRLQAVLDRVFFRAAYDFRRLVETTSARLAAGTELPLVVEEIESAVEGALHPSAATLYVRRGEGESFEAVPAFRGRLDWDLFRLAEGHAGPVDAPGGALLVPFRVESELLAVLVLGPRLSGRIYGGDDRAMLRTLANQGAVAVQNALAVERLRELNRDLERKVDERTAELARAVDELRATQSQLVHQEKMASLGQLVAGIAHEINNPLNFIQGNLHFLRSHAESLAEAFRELAGRVPGAREELTRIREEKDLDFVLSDLESVLAACEEGVERTTDLVRNLRTFSRSDAGEVSELDLHDAIETTLTLLGSRIRFLEIHRDYGEIPPLQCLASQIKQVLMNLLANAADAVGDRGRIGIRTRRVGRDRILLRVEDDGCGIAAEHRDRIFEPFFTTKEVGRGTGLGLAITYGVVSRHGGHIRVESTPGAGTTFEVELPIRFAGEAATGSGETAAEPEGNDP